MLIITKPTLFAPDGMAVRGQCGHDAPGWHLSWFNSGEPPTLLWQGAYRVCRRLQSGCLGARNLDEAKVHVEMLLNSATRLASQNTEIVSAQAVADSLNEQARRKKKRKRHA